MGDLLFDIILVALLVFFAWRGAAKGLILSLCGLAAVFAAFFAAQFVSDTFCRPVANIIRPIIVQSLSELVPDNPLTVVEVGPNQSTVGYSYTLDDMLASIREEGLFKGFSGFLEEGVKSNAVEESSRLSPLEALAGYLARGIARTLLFALVFFGGLLAWFLFSHALDLAFKLPILAEVNLVGGLALGLVKGALVAVVLVWLGQLAGVVPAPPETPVLSLFTVDRLGELLENLPG